MLKKILLATDGSPCAGEAARFLGALPLPAGTQIQVVCVVDVFVENVLEAVQPHQRDYVLRVLESAAEIVRREGIEVSTLVRAGEAAHQLITGAEELGADLLVLGTVGRTGLEDLVLGSVARNVAKHASCPVLVVRKPASELDRVLVATDGSAHAEQAVRFAAAFPAPALAEFTVTHVVRTEHPVLDAVAIASDDLYGALEEEERKAERRGKELLQAAQSVFRTEERACDVVLRKGDPAAQILALSRERAADLLIAGARGASLIRRLVVGSVADRLLKQAPCSVLIVR